MQGRSQYVEKVLSIIYQVDKRIKNILSYAIAINKLTYMHHQEPLLRGRATNITIG